MELYHINLPDATPVARVSAFSTFGIGFLTSIMKYISDIAGIECTLYDDKLEKAKIAATDYIVSEASRYGADGIMGVRYEFSGLSVFAYGTAFKRGHAVPPMPPVPPMAPPVVNQPPQPGFAPPPGGAFPPAPGYAPANDGTYAIYHPQAPGAIPVNRPATPSYGYWICKNCGTQNKDFTSMCKNCGSYKLTEEE